MPLEPAAFVSLPKDVMGAAAQCEVLTPPRYAGAGPAEQAALEEAARLINQAKVPVVLLGMMASKPQNVEAVREFIRKLNLPVVGTFQAAGAISHNLFKNFGGRVGQLANQPRGHHRWCGVAEVRELRGSVSRRSKVFDRSRKA